MPYITARSKRPHRKHEKMADKNSKKTTNRNSEYKSNKWNESSKQEKSDDSETKMARKLAAMLCYKGKVYAEKLFRQK